MTMKKRVKRNIELLVMDMLRESKESLYISTLHQMIEERTSISLNMWAFIKMLNYEKPRRCPPAPIELTTQRHPN